MLEMRGTQGKCALSRGEQGFKNPEPKLSPWWKEQEALTLQAEGQHGKEQL